MRPHTSKLCNLCKSKLWTLYTQALKPLQVEVSELGCFGVRELWRQSVQKTRLSRGNAGEMVPLQQKADSPRNEEPAIARLRMVSDAHSVEQFLVFLLPKQRQPSN